MTTETQTNPAKTSFPAKPGEWLRAFERGMDFDPAAVLHHSISTLEARFNALDSNTLAQKETRHEIA
jgi:hypothetical protein